MADARNVSADVQDARGRDELIDIVTTRASNMHDIDDFDDFAANQLVDARATTASESVLAGEPPDTRCPAGNRGGMCASPHPGPKASDHRKHGIVLMRLSLCRWRLPIHDVVRPLSHF